MSPWRHRVRVWETASVCISHPSSQHKLPAKILCKVNSADNPQSGGGYNFVAYEVRVPLDSRVQRVLPAILSDVLGLSEMPVVQIFRVVICNRHHGVNGIALMFPPLVQRQRPKPFQRRRITEMRPERILADDPHQHRPRDIFDNRLLHRQI